MKTSARNPKPGITRVDPEIRGLVADDVHLEHVSGLGALDGDGPGQRMGETEVEASAVRVGALAGQQPVEPVTRLEA